MSIQKRESYFGTTIPLGVSHRSKMPQSFFQKRINHKRFIRIYMKIKDKIYDRGRGVARMIFALRIREGIVGMVV